jgi:hypothetical protein
VLRRRRRVAATRGDGCEVRQRDALSRAVPEPLEDGHALRVQLERTVEVALVDGQVAELSGAARGLAFVADLAVERERSAQLGAAPRTIAAA